LKKAFKENQIGTFLGWFIAAAVFEQNKKEINEITP
jgi:hypothetical protein